MRTASACGEAGCELACILNGGKFDMSNGHFKLCRCWVHDGFGVGIYQIVAFASCLLQILCSVIFVVALLISAIAGSGLPSPHRVVQHSDTC